MKKRLLIIIIILSIALIITTILTAFLLKNYSYSRITLPEEAYIKTLSQIEVFSDTKLSNLIYETNMEIKTQDKIIDTETIGVKEETLLLKFNKREYDYTFTYEVIDVTPPKLLSAKYSYTTLLNQSIDPCENAFYVDDYDDEPTCEISGTYDLTKTGTYNVKYEIKDNSNNITEKDLKIKVIDKWPQSTDTTNTTTTTETKTKHIQMSEVINTYKNENTEIGIDVSRWQTDIDFEKVKNAGVEFVIMRIGVQSDIDKDLSVDSYYYKNIKAAKEAGLKVGVYVYTSAITKKAAKETADWVVKILDGEKLDFPIAYDWENWSKFKSYKVSLHNFSECFNTFYAEVNKSGYTAMLYSSKYYLENIWINKNNYPVWLAHYTSQTNYEGEYYIWQKGNNGRVDGISGNVDIDILYKNKEPNN